MNDDNSLQEQLVQKKQNGMLLEKKYLWKISFLCDKNNYA
jgi:hypothetical protein